MDLLDERAKGQDKNLTQDADLSKWGELGNLVQLPLDYPKAPIVEAILQIHVTPADTLAVDDLQTLLTAEDGYGPAEQAIAFDGEVSLVDTEVINKVEASKVGYIFRRHDLKRVVQAHRDSFIFSWLPPYEHWKQFSEEALDHWTRYQRTAQPSSVQSIGVRTINKIPLPDRATELKDYVRISVDVPAYLPQALASMFSQVRVPLSMFGAIATITSVLQPRSDGTQGPPELILDIDIQKSLSLDLADVGFHESLLGALQEARDAKNFVFEACITDATRGLISK
ncbi:TIGR04255 family protein [Pseudarthrobacter sp. NamE5]|uniref:TIGR04255 family protein n=1 Tax=Pseudarthrobacter sp. NamE5 TaxID=2576839 RepID=UPI001485E51D|nr:TIGR04255 family protein [Pseudarthrobacter sp. NamE5]